MAGDTPSEAATQRASALRSRSGSLGPLLAELAAAPPVAGVLSPGTRIGASYEILRKLGQGGMGVVYLAEDVELRRRVALKLRHGAGISADEVSRLRREAQAMARLSHPNVVAVLDIGDFRGCLFIAMEFVDGGTARTWAKARRRSPREVIEFYAGAARGLAAAHDVGIVHRDFKPDNVLVGVDGRVRVADFGLATAVQLHAQDWPVAPDATGPQLSLTGTGAIVGTPRYMAPEQFEGSTVDARADQFSFCVSVYEAIYGEAPFKGTTLPELAHAVTSGTMLEPPTGSNVPVGIWRALGRGLAVAPADRWPSMDALVAALRAEARRRRGARVGALVAAAAALGLGAAAAATTSPSGACDTADGVPWDAAGRTQIAKQFNASATPIADHARDHALDGLDVYAARLAELRAAACDGARDDAGAFDRQMACLRERTRDFQGVVSLLATASDSEVERAQETVAGLPPLAGCEPSAVADRAPVPPDAKAEVARLSDALAQAKLEARALQLDDNLAALEPLLEQARATDYGLLVAEVLVARGDALSYGGRFHAATTSFEEAYFLALRGHDDGLAIQAALGVIRFGVRAAIDLGHVLRFAAAAGPLFDKASAEQQAQFLIARGWAYGQADHDDVARREYDAALAMHPSDDTRKHVYSGLAQLERFSGNPRAALDLFTKERALWVKSHGAEHLRVAQSDQEIASMHNELGNNDLAQELSDRSRATIARVLGDDSPRLITCYSLAAAIAGAQGHVREMIEHYQRALTLQQDGEPESPEKAIHPLINMANGYDKLGDHRKALELGQRAAVLSLEHFGAGGRETLGIKLNNATVLRSMGEYERALTAMEEVIDALRASDAPEKRFLLAALLNRIFWLVEDDPDHALESVQEAEALANEIYAAPAREHGFIARVRADALAAKGDHAGALAAYREAGRLFVSIAGEGHPDHVQALGDTADQLEQLGRADEARAALEDAVAFVEGGTEVSPALSADLKIMLAQHLPRTERARALGLARDATELLADSPTPAGERIRKKAEDFVSANKRR